MLFWLNRIVGFLIIIFNWIKQKLLWFLGLVWNLLIKVFMKTKQHLSKKKLIVLIILLASTIPLFLGFISWRDNIEGNLVVEKFSFTSNQSDKRFLNSLIGINKLIIEGELNFSLEGTFRSELQPRINQLTSLQIKLGSDQSQLVITPENSKLFSDIALNELRLQEPTKITELNYNSFGNRLSLSLDPFQSQRNTKNYNYLQLYFGNQPLKITLQGYEISGNGLQVQDSPDAPNPIELTFIPKIKDFQLKLPKKTYLSLNLPNPKKVDSTNWFWGDLEVQDLNFYSLKGSSNQRDEIYNSTILEGKLRMAQQELKIEPYQFLKVEKPGFEKLRHLQIKHPQGIEVRIAGKTTLAQVGLDPNFPIFTIKSNFLIQFFSKDIVLAIIAFFSAIIAALLPQLFD